MRHTVSMELRWNVHNINIFHMVNDPQEHPVDFARYPLYTMNISCKGAKVGGKQEKDPLGG